MISRFIIPAAVSLATLNPLAKAHDTPACPDPVKLAESEDLIFPGRFAIAAGYAYIINDYGRELITIDLSTAPDYQTVNTLDFDSLSYDGIVVHENAAYLTDGVDIIQVVDLSNPAAPEMGDLIQTTDMNLVHRPVVIGDYLYAGTGDIYDITDPVQPDHAAVMDLPDPIADMQHGLAYTTRIQPVDLSDPLNPTVNLNTTRFNGSSFTQIDIDPITDRLYATRGGYIDIFDISQPEAPDQLYSTPTYPVHTNYRTPRIGSLLFTNGSGAEYGSNIDLYDASSDEDITTVPLDLDLFEYDTPSFMQLIDGTFYILSGWQFSAFRLTTAPYVTAAQTAGHPVGVHKHGDLIFTAEEDFGVGIYDATDPARLHRIADFDTIDSASAIDARGDTLYIAAERDDLVILDISDPSNPTQITTIETGRRARDVRVLGDDLFVVDRIDGLSIFDISDPNSPILRSTLDMPGWNNHISFSGDGQLACIASGPYDAIILDISDRQNPSIITTITPLDNTSNNDGIQTTAFDGNLLYTPEDLDGYRVWDISDPANPAPVAHHEISYTDIIGDPAISIVYQVTPHNGKVLVANGNDGLAVYDNTDPTAPIYERYFHTQPIGNNLGSVRRVLVENDLAYTAVYGGGLRIHDLAACAPCPADFNQDGQLDYFDLTAFIAAFTDGNPAADINQDGRLTFFDIATFLASYTGGCP